MPKLNTILMTVFAGALVVMAGLLSLRSRQTPRAPQVQIERLLRKLGDPDPEVGEEGGAGLCKAGAAAWSLLREASRRRTFCLLKGPPGCFWNSMPQVRRGLKSPVWSLGPSPTVRRISPG